jgi:two-component system sensor kinase FixL
MDGSRLDWSHGASPPAGGGAAPPATFLELARRLGAVFWVYDFTADRILFVSDAVGDMYGVSAAELYADAASWHASVHPDDMPELTQTLRRLAELDFDVQYRRVLKTGEVRWIRSRSVNVTTSDAGHLHVAGWSEDVTTVKRTRNALEQLARGFGAQSSEVYLARLVVQVADLVDAQAVLVTESVDEARARIVSLHAREAMVPDVQELPIKGTPCEEPYRGAFHLIQAGVRARHPNVRMLEDTASEGYAGVPLHDNTGERLGVLFALFPRPIEDPVLVETVLRLCADRAGSELARVRAESRGARRPAGQLSDALFSRSSERYRAFFERSANGIFCLELDTPIPLDLPPKEQVQRLARLARIVECNAAFSESQGFAHPSDLIGRLATAVPQFRTGYARTLLTSLAKVGWRVERMPVQPVGSDGALFLNYDLLPVIEDDCLVRLWVTRRDVTERVLEQQALRRSQEHLASIFESAMDGIVVLDGEHRVVDTNSAFLTLTGHRREEVLGLHLASFDARLQQDELDELLLAARAAGPLQRRGVLQRKDGQPLEVEVSSCYRDLSGGRTYCFVHDISERLAAEERAQRHQTQLAHFSRLNTIGEMASGIAHELNQPLAAIVNYTRGSIRRLHARGEEDRLLLEALENAAGQADRAGQIIRRMRNFVRKGEHRHDPHPLAELVRESIEFADSVVRSRGVLLRLDLDDPEVHVMVDPIQVEQVLLNLLRNAVEAMDDVPAERRELIVRTAPAREGFARVSVLDNGPGLVPGRADEVFTPFFSTKAEGVGLGLSISRSIIEGHGGRLWCEVHTGGGCCFHFTLPVTSGRIRGS